MLKFGVDADTLGVKIDRVTQAVTTAYNLAVTEAYDAVVDATPAHTGFLQASWYVRVNGQPGRHPNPPSKRAKRISDYARPFRRLPLNPPRRNVYNAKFGGYDYVANFGANIGGGAPRAVHPRQIGARQTLAFVNDAPYAEQADLQHGLQSVAKRIMSSVLRVRLQRALKAELARRR